LKTVEYSSWPIIAYTQAIDRHFGSTPSYVIGVSSDGPDHYYRGYDFVSAAKALLEHFARYLSVHLLPRGGRCNVVRFGTVRTPSFDAIFGSEYFEYVKSEGVSEEFFLTPEQCGKTILALCSGLLAPVNGQVLTVDYGLPFQDNLMMRYIRTKEQDER
jgi:enoyl-[acyl-carrier-protein] reductase (NADH)